MDKQLTFVEWKQQNHPAWYLNSQEQDEALFEDYLKYLKENNFDPAPANPERFLKWAFEAPDDVVLPEDFERWEKEQLLKEAEQIMAEVEADPDCQVELTEEQREKMHDRLMQRIKEYEKNRTL